MSGFERATTIRCNALEDSVMMYVAPWNGSYNVLYFRAQIFERSYGVKSTATVVHSKSWFYKCMLFC